MAANNQGIVHYRSGGKTGCNRALISVHVATSIEKFRSEAHPCKRCSVALAKMDTIARTRAAIAAASRSEGV